MQNLEPIKARLAAATPGPWYFTNDAGPTHVAEVSALYVRPEAPLRSPMADAALIAHAPADLAALIAEVERLRDERDDWRGRSQAQWEISEASMLMVHGLAELARDHGIPQQKIDEAMLGKPKPVDESAV